MSSVVGSGMHYIRNGDGVEQLFDLSTDPDEQIDLARREDAAPRLAWFRRTLAELRAHAGDRGVVARTSQ
jgi:hypothetical protein